MVRFVPLFTAKIKDGIVDYKSRQTGFHYIITPTTEGFYVDGIGDRISVWTSTRLSAINIIRETDLARLADLSL